MQQVRKTLRSPYFFISATQRECARQNPQSLRLGAESARIRTIGSRAALSVLSFCCFTLSVLSFSIFPLALLHDITNCARLIHSCRNSTTNYHIQRYTRTRSIIEHSPSSVSYLHTIWLRGVCICAITSAKSLSLHTLYRHRLTAYTIRARVVHLHCHLLSAHRPSTWLVSVRFRGRRHVCSCRRPLLRPSPTQAYLLRSSISSIMSTHLFVSYTSTTFLHKSYLSASVIAAKLWSLASPLPRLYKTTLPHFPTLVYTTTDCVTSSTSILYLSHSHLYHYLSTFYFIIPLHRESLFRTILSIFIHEPLSNIYNTHDIPMLTL